MPKTFLNHRIAEYHCPCGKGHVSQSEQKLMVWVKLHGKYCDLAPTKCEASLLDVINFDEETMKPKKLNLKKLI